MESPDPFLSRPVQNFSATDEIERKGFTCSSSWTSYHPLSGRERCRYKADQKEAAHIQTILT